MDARELLHIILDALCELVGFQDVAFLEVFDFAAVSRWAPVKKLIDKVDALLLISKSDKVGLKVIKDGEPRLFVIAGGL